MVVILKNGIIMGQLNLSAIDLINSSSTNQKN